jgi:hypothetical protein
MISSVKSWFRSPTKEDAKVEPVQHAKPDGYKSSQSSSAILMDPSGNLMVKHEKSNSEEEKSND